MPDKVLEAATDPRARSALRPSRLALGLSLLLVTAIGAASWLLVHPEPRTPAPRTATPLAAGTIDRLPNLSAWMPAAAEEAQRRAEAGPPATPEADPPEQVQVCGGAWVTTQPDGSPSPSEPPPQVRAAGERIIASLQTDPDPYARAVGLWLERPDMTADLAESRERWSAIVHRLADMAMHGDDARIYALAIGACNRRRDDAACAQLSFEQWARLDPDNGYPWMFVADEAVQRRDDATRDEALYRLSTATHVDSGAYDAPRVIASRATRDDASLLAAFGLAAQTFGIEAARPFPYQTILQACRLRIEQDPNRWQTCSGAASALAERSDNLLSRAIGRAMGKRLGWPTDRLDRLGGEAARWSKHQGDVGAQALEEARTGSCDGIRRWLDALARSDRQGEIGVLKAALAASAVSDDELLRLGRAERERREAVLARADEAAKAASAPKSDADSAAAPSPAAQAASGIDAPSLSPSAAFTPR